VVNARTGEGHDGERSLPGLLRGKIAKTESSARFAEPAEPVGPAVTSIAAVDRRRVKESFLRLGTSPQFAMDYLYARLFVQSPALRSLFPLSMEHTRATTFRMLVDLMENLDDPERADLMLAELGRDHRKFGVKDEHYQPFFDCLLATIEQVSGQAWTDDLRRAWRAVLTYFAATMTAAAQEDGRSQPAWWIGEIVQHDQRTPTIAVLTIRPDRPLSYHPGQYVSVQVPKWPRVWRKYSIANAPRENGLLDIHVRAVPGGMVSTALVSHSGTGDTLTLAAARGDLRVPADQDRDIVCVAGGTGLAPVKAIVESIVAQTRQGKRRSVTLYLGARHGGDLYDMRDLATLRLAYPALTLVPVAESDPDWSAGGFLGVALPGQHSWPAGKLPDVVARHPSFRDTEVYVAGPAGLVTATTRALGHRVPADRFHHDSLDALLAASHPVPAPGLAR
jgi:NAD(P)H-flavin reductase/hemoglobin-like flavoprotein